MTDSTDARRAEMVQYLMTRAAAYCLQLRDASEDGYTFRIMQSDNAHALLEIRDDGAILLANDLTLDEARTVIDALVREVRRLKGGSDATIS